MKDTQIKGRHLKNPLPHQNLPKNISAYLEFVGGAQIRSGRISERARLVFAVCTVGYHCKIGFLYFFLR